MPTPQERFLKLTTICGLSTLSAATNDKDSEALEWALAALLNANSFALTLTNAAAVKPDEKEIEKAKDSLLNAIGKCADNVEDQNTGANALSWSKPIPVLLSTYELIDGRKVDDLVPFTELTNNIYLP